MLVDVTTGSENFPNASCKAYLFAVPTPRFPGNEAHLFQVARDAQNGVRAIKGAGSNTRASTIGSDFKMGSWSRDRFDIPDGMVLKIFATRKVTWNSMETRALMFIRPRAGAALRNVTMNTTQSEISSARNVTIISGRFDVLTLDELRQAGGDVGKLIPPHMQRAASPEAVGAILSVVELAPEEVQAVTAQARIVSNSDGQRVEVVMPARRRVFEDD